MTLLTVIYHHSDNIQTTAWQFPLSLLDEARQTFALHISSIFPSKSLQDVTIANVIQDVNIRIFHNTVAEVMGISFQDFIRHSIMFTILSTNGVAVLWLSDATDFVQRVLIINNEAVIAARLNVINTREAPISITLGDCQSSARFFVFVYSK